MCVFLFFRIVSGRPTASKSFFRKRHGITVNTPGRLFTPAKSYSSRGGRLLPRSREADSMIATTKIELDSHLTSRFSYCCRIHTRTRYAHTPAAAPFVGVTKGKARSAAVAPWLPSLRGLLRYLKKKQKNSKHPWRNTMEQ